MNISVIGGTGYVGLTVAVCLANKGHLVFCVGRNEEKVSKINRGVPIIYEENLEELLKDALKQKKLVATTNLKDAVKKSNVSFICVGTQSMEDGRIDLRQVEGVSVGMGQALREKEGYHVVTVKSTVVPGTTEDFVIPILEKFSGKKAGVDFGVCMNPEFLREGRAIGDFLFPKDTGIVIGELDERSGSFLLEIFKEFEGEIFRTSLRCAEMIKYARNSYLAKDVSFANEIANMCQMMGIDYLGVKKGMEMDVRIGKGRFLDAGVGFGGSCFPKDVRALVTKSAQVGVDPRMLEATLKVNEEQPFVAVKLIKQVLGGLKNKKIAVLGTAFKPGTDDMREAPSIKVVNGLLAEGAEVWVYDPKALANARKIFGDTVFYGERAEEALSEAEGCIIVTEWPEFAEASLYAAMQGKVIVDGRRFLDPGELPPGFRYHAVGFPRVVET
ncbi:MAG: UDP-glucose/GDP-mannose dehydrogenase family protein [Candidatus Bathyarchaeota archaeon]|nr:UDP-glucose/GDP-mannose dehydrogenase family protein [Candidatus Bathyarchaeota archaeon]